MKSRLLLLSWFVLFTAGNVFGQLDQRASQEQREKQQQELNAKALVLVNELTSAASSLKLPENRCYLLSRTADLVWDHDEKLARNLFWESVNNLNLIGSSMLNKSSGRKASNEQILISYSATYSLRRDLLETIAKHDPQFALEVLNATRQPPPEVKNSQFQLPNESDLEQLIALAATAHDPKFALRSAKESLAKGLSPELINLLFLLNQKDPELGTKFAGDIIDKLRSENLAVGYVAPLIAVNLLRASRAPAANEAEKPSPGGKFRRLTLAEEQRRELVEMITSAALTVSGDGNIFLSISEIMPEVEQFTPGRALSLKRKLAEINRTLNSDQRAWNEHNVLIEGGDPLAMLRAAGNHDGDRRSSLEDAAIITAVMRRQVDSMRDEINNEIDDESRRKKLIERLDGEEVEYAASRGDAEALQKVLAQARRKEERARAMARLAILLEKKGEHEKALKYLEEAHSLVRINISDESKANALLDLILAYALIEPATAFMLLERAIDRTNEEISKALLLEMFVKSGMIRKGEILFQNNGGIPADFAVFKYGEGVAALATADFIRTKGLADRFQRNELRLMARLLLARALLTRQSFESATQVPQ